MLLAFGVRPSEFLSLQEFLPKVRENKEKGELEAEWDERHTGHSGNWTDRNVRFCLNTFLDVALKVQDAAWHPSPIEFDFIFDDVITAKEDEVVLWIEEMKGGGAWMSGTVTVTTDKPERVTVKTLSKGESLRVRIMDFSPSGIESLTRLFSKESSHEHRGLIRFGSDQIPNRFPLFVEADKVDISKAPREIDFIRDNFPHLF